MIKPIIRKPVNFVKKNWGSETWIINKEYCGKVLMFEKGAKFSLHYHLNKEEVFFLQTGKVLFKYFDLRNADKLEETILPGTCIEIPRGCPHQIEALEESLVIEISTHHEDNDSYRIKKGDSQK